MGELFVGSWIKVLAFIFLMGLTSLAEQSAPEASSRQTAESRNMQLVGHHDLQGRSAYQPVIQAQDGRWIAYIGHHNGRARNPLTSVVETNGTSIVDVTEQAKFVQASPRDFVVLVSESFASMCQEDAHDMVFMVDITDETRPFPVANYQVPESKGNFCQRGGRFGAHSLNWSYNPAFYKKLIVVSYFNAGVRAVDIRDPFHPVEVGFFIPAITKKTAWRGRQQAIQTNNVEIDNRGYIYLADRANTGLHIVRMTDAAAQIVTP